MTDRDHRDQLTRTVILSEDVCLYIERWWKGDSRLAEVAVAVIAARPAPVVELDSWTLYRDERGAWSTSVTEITNSLSCDALDRIYELEQEARQ